MAQAGGREMHVVVTGAAGFLGRKLAARIARMGRVGPREVTTMTLVDLARPPAPEGPVAVETVAADIAKPSACARLIRADTGLVVHLAAVVSAAAEADFALGWRVNLDGTRALLEACRARASAPRFVFASSVATFSGGQGAVIRDDTRPVPANSYGAQKAAGELLVHDWTRKGFVDGVSLRLPTIVIRPGRPNRAASSFASSILREPLIGEEAALPVAEDFALWIASPRAAVDWLLHAASMDGAALGLDRGVNPPGLTVTVGEMLAALEGVAGAEARRAGAAGRGS
ncbi:MAG: NAD-dependent epimerase/dehydratase family protein [Acetobacteraceae bacterium]|nr:NAD-dependent epimerase/dehydratase family protein [Acetobacteraceae bacterium]